MSEISKVVTAKRIHEPAIQIFGLRIRARASWFIMVALVTWSLATIFFPHQFRQYTGAQYWFMAVVTAAGLFASILFHEISHSIVARKFNMHVKGITLFMFGGIAESMEEPPNPKVEFWTAIAGPICSLVLGLLFWFGHKALPDGIFNDVSLTLASLNFALAIFNLIPAFPLDGGRILRAAIWQVKKDSRFATRFASRCGEVSGTFMVVLGVIGFLSGNIVGGLWWVLLGLFLKQIARLTFEQYRLFEVLGQQRVRDIMTPQLAKVSPATNLDDFVHDFVYRYHQDIFPVTDRDRLVGGVRTEDVKPYSAPDWKNHSVNEIMKPLAQPNMVSGDANVSVVLKRIAEEESDMPMIVVENNRPIGSLSLADIMDFYLKKRELELTA